MKSNYKRLGDYICEVDVRNKELSVTTLIGLTINKAFIPSVANVIGTDLSNYKIICKEQFACSLMQVSRDGKMPVAMFTDEIAIMSPAYPMFEVIDKSILMPQYLKMWFSRQEFDREASFYAVGGVRGSLTWEDFCDMRLPIPSIERQREIVAEYETLSKRIHLNEQLISKLEDTAQTLYRKMFVDGIEEYLNLGNIILPKKGKNITRQNCLNGKIPVVAGGIEPSCYHNVSNTEFPVITISASGANAGYVSFYNQKIWASDCSYIDASMYKYIYFLYVLLKNNQEKIFAMQEGTGQPHIYPEHISNLKIPQVENKEIEVYNNYARLIYEQSFILKEENKILTELESLLLAKIGQ